MNRSIKQLSNAFFKQQNTLKFDDNEIVDEERFRTLEFNKETNKLTFIIEHYHRRPKITRYVTFNYVRTPIYGDYTERTRIIKKFDKTINPLRFVNEQIQELNINKQFMLDIINEIGITPAWRQKEIDLEKKRQNINSVKQEFRDYKTEKHEYQFKATNHIEKPSNFWWRLVFVPITLGYSFVGYISKKTAQMNQKLNQKNKIWNQKHRKEVDQHNEKLKQTINLHNQKIQKNIDFLENQYQEILTRPLELTKVDENGWINLNQAVHLSQPSLKNQKGVYIIWNKTKNKYYVGQSKNMEHRLFNQHFNNGQVKDIIFAKDWYEKDAFYYKYFICATKDELDALQKRYIDEYDAFENGYNSTSGRK